MNSAHTFKRRLLTTITAALFATGASAGTAGTALLNVMPKSNKVQQSNYGKNSFTLINTGTKDIVEFQIDVTDAIFSDIVFDPKGLAGDSVAKPLKIDTDGVTGVISPKAQKANTYIGDGGAKGYKGLRITFDPDVDGGFNPGEKLGFSIDMDPNSLAGTQKKPIDQATSPKWDCGGVSGAEMIGSSFSVVFNDGTRASGQLFSTNTQAGSRGFATEQTTDAPVQLSVNGIGPGENGHYSVDNFELKVKGPKDARIRVVLVKGFIQPVSAYNAQLESQLHELAKQDFPANNAAELRSVNLTATGEWMNITDRFNLSDIEHYDFAASTDGPFSVDEDKLPLAITAAVMGDKGRPASTVLEPIYLLHTSQK